jgi:dipeptidyl aminopeptidase/acylaminoacyl peptidase
LELHPGEGHGLHRPESWTFLSDRMVEFFKEQL